MSQATNFAPDITFAFCAWHSACAKHQQMLLSRTRLCICDDMAVTRSGLQPWSRRGALNAISPDVYFNCSKYFHMLTRLLMFLCLAQLEKNKMVEGKKDLQDIFLRPLKIHQCFPVLVSIPQGVRAKVTQLQLRVFSQLRLLPTSVWTSARSSKSLLQAWNFKKILEYGRSSLLQAATWQLGTAPHWSFFIESVFGRVWLAGTWCEQWQTREAEVTMCLGILLALRLATCPVFQCDCDSCEPKFRKYGLCVRIVSTNGGCSWKGVAGSRWHFCLENHSLFTESEAC